MFGCFEKLGALPRETLGSFEAASGSFWADIKQAWTSYDHRDYLAVSIDWVPFLWVSSY